MTWSWVLMFLNSCDSCRKRLLQTVRTPYPHSYVVTKHRTQIPLLFMDQMGLRLIHHSSVPELPPEDCCLKKNTTKYSIVLVLAVAFCTLQGCWSLSLGSTMLLDRLLPWGGELALLHQAYREFVQHLGQKKIQFEIVLQNVFLLCSTIK